MGRVALAATGTLVDEHAPSPQFFSHGNVGLGQGEFPAAWKLMTGSGNVQAKLLGTMDEQAGKGVGDVDHCVVSGRGPGQNQQ